MSTINEALPRGCSGGEFFRLISETVGAEYTNNRLKGCSAKQSQGVAVRVTKDGRLGSAVESGTPDLSALAAAAEKVCPYGPKAWFDFAPSAQLTASEKLYVAAEAEQSTEDLVGWGGRVLERLRKRWPDLICSAGASRGTVEVEMSTSQGFEGGFRSSSFGLGAGVQASREGDIFHWGAEYPGIPTDSEFDAFLEHCHERIALGLQVAQIESGSWPVILSPNCLALLLRVLEAGVKGNAIYEKKSPLWNKSGEKVLNDTVTILDDPTWNRTSKTVPFDDEGVPTRQRRIIDAGVFTGPITDREFAAKLELEPTGNCYREQHIYRTRVLASSGSIGAGNWRLAPGGTPLADLIAGIDKGVYVDGSFDCWMGNIVNGDFQGTLHQAYLVEKGRLVGRLKARAFSGNIYDVLGDRLAAMSTEVARPTNGFGTLEAPHVLVSAMDIS